MYVERKKIKTQIFIIFNFTKLNLEPRFPMCDPCSTEGLFENIYIFKTQVDFFRHLPWSFYWTTFNNYVQNLLKLILLILKIFCCIWDYINYFVNYFHFHISFSILRVFNKCLLQVLVVRLLPFLNKKLQIIGIVITLLIPFSHFHF